MKRSNQPQQNQLAPPKQIGLEQIKFNSEFINTFSSILFPPKKT